MRDAPRRIASVRFVVGDIPDDGSEEQVEPADEQLRASSSAPARLEVVPGEGHVFTDPQSMRRLLEVVREFTFELPAGQGAAGS